MTHLPTTRIVQWRRSTCTHLLQQFSQLAEYELRDVRLGERLLHLEQHRADFLHERLQLDELVRHLLLVAAQLLQALQLQPQVGYETLQRLAHVCQHTETHSHSAVHVYVHDFVCVCSNINLTKKTQIFGPMSSWTVSVIDYNLVNTLGFQTKDKHVITIDDSTKLP